MSSQELAQLWESGSLSCPIRNKFIIPEIVDLIKQLRPSTVLDIGCGTGYIARKVAAQSRQTIHWTLVDMSSARLDLARSLCPDTPDWSFQLSNVLETPIPERKADLVILANTLLEMPVDDRLISSLKNHVSTDGHISILLPDTLSDVMEDLQLLEEYKNKTVQLDKTDRFTGMPYPFLAHRAINVIIEFTTRGFSLRSIKPSISVDNYFHICFRLDGEK